MAELPHPAEAEKTRLILSLLESVERDGRQSQRGLAAELGVALGLVNAYLRRAISKGLVKVREAPTRRYAYYLTPKGFAEKSRLTLEYLSYSFAFLQRARIAYAEVIGEAHARAFRRVVFAGVSELAEIATLCAIDKGIEIVAIVDPNATCDRWAGHSVVPTFSSVRERFDAVIVTDLQRAADAYAEAVSFCGRDAVLAPGLLGLESAGAAVTDRHT